MVSSADVLDEDKFSVELVVQCIRVSDVPQTHHHALLLLGAAAAIFPVSTHTRTHVILMFHTLRSSLIFIIIAVLPASAGEGAAQHHAHLHLHGSKHHAAGRRLQLPGHRQDSADGRPRPHPGLLHQSRNTFPLINEII